MDESSEVAKCLARVLDRGSRQDFFDLYLTLQVSSIGILEAVGSLRRKAGREFDEFLVLKSITWFGDAEREAALPGEGKKDWAEVKDFFLTRVGNLLTPPTRPLEIQGRIVDVVESQ